jgi:glycerophosphoryl diester phosphodiesterase
MKILKRLLNSLLIIAIVFIVLFALPKPKYDNNNVWLKENNNDLPLVMAHAGGKGIFPDNTLSAFEYSYNLGVDVIEMDVQMTSDRILVLRHGENDTGNIRSKSNCDTVVWHETYDYLYNNCNFAYNYIDQFGNYPYQDMTKEEWINAKVYLTTLEELFVLYGDTILYNIEIKADADAWRFETADELYDLLEEYNLFDNVLVATSFSDISEYIINTYPEINLSTSHSEAQSMIISTYTLTSVFYKPEGYSSLQIPTSFGVPVINELDLATWLLINTAHRHNMAVHYWTINDEITMRKLIELGCDGIITDYPELLIDILKDYS